MLRRLLRTLAAAVVLSLSGVTAAAALPVEPGDHWLIEMLRDAGADAAPTNPPSRKPAPPACSRITGGDIPQLVADIFRCRLREAGIPEPEVAKLTAEAVTVAHCESGFDPNVVVFDGRYVATPHPQTGSFYTAAGVFQFIRRVGDIWIENGGYANVMSPTANIDAAARLFLHNRALGYGGWGEWACAGANDGFRATSVLPGWPGGPPHLPEWATRY